jgi:ABC-2 type transport system permease protein
LRRLGHSALYPLWRVREGSPSLATVCRLNPFTYAVELIRFAFYGRIEPISLELPAPQTSDQFPQSR